MKKYTLSVIVITTLFICSSFVVRDWVRITGKDGKCAISFPHSPAESSQTLNPSSGPISMHMFVYDASVIDDDNLLYAFAYSDYSPQVVSSDSSEEMQNAVFDRAIDFCIKSINGTVVSREKITFKSYPGLHAKIAFSKGFFVLKVILVKSRLYVMEVGCAESKDNNPSINKFFGSFKLLSDK